MAAAYTGTPSRLVSAPIDLSALREDLWRELTALFESLEGRICLVVESRLSPALKLIAVDGSRALRDWRVHDVHELTSVGPPLTLTADADTVLFLTRPATPSLRAIAGQIHAWKRRLTVSAGGSVATGGLRGPRHVAVAVVPRKTFLAEQFFKEEGVYDDIALLEYGLDILPLDDDVLSLLAEGAFTDVALHGDASPLYATSRALVKLQAAYGVIPVLRGKGAAARLVVEQLLRTQREAEGAATGAAPPAVPSTSGTSGEDASVAGVSSMTVYVTQDGVGGSSGPAGGAARCEIHSCVILDRSIDLVTPMVTPLTVEAQIDEVFGITASQTIVDSSIIGDAEEDDALDHAATTGPASGKGRPPAAKLPERLPLHLNSNVKLFAEVRDVNITAAGPRLASRARELQAMRDSITKSDTEALKVADIKKFVKQIPGLQADLKSLKVVVALVSTIQTETNDAKFMDRWQLERLILDEESGKEVGDAIQASIAKRQPLVKTLRLLCLLCAVEGGLKNKVLDGYRHAIIAAYGFETLLTLRALEAAGLLWGKEGGSALGAAFGGVGSGVSAWTQLRKLLALTTDDAHVEEPRDTHFVTAGYAPLSVRLIQALLPGGSGWESGPVAEALKLLPGPQVTVSQVVRTPVDATAVAASSEGDGEGAAARVASERKVMLVVYVGGVTHIEINCLRFLAERHPVDFIVLATSVTNGSKMIQGLITPLDNRLGTAGQVAAAATPAPSAAAAAAASKTPAGKPAAAGAAKGK